MAGPRAASAHDPAGPAAASPTPAGLGRVLPHPAPAARDLEQRLGGLHGRGLLLLGGCRARIVRLRHGHRPRGRRSRQPRSRGRRVGVWVQEITDSTSFAPVLAGKPRIAPVPADTRVLRVEIVTAELVGDPLEAQVDTRVGGFSVDSRYGPPPQAFEIHLDERPPDLSVSVRRGLGLGLRAVQGLRRRPLVAVHVGHRGHVRPAWDPGDRAPPALDWQPPARDEGTPCLRFRRTATRRATRRATPTSRPVARQGAASRRARTGGPTCRHRHRGRAASHDLRPERRARAGCRRRPRPARTGGFAARVPHAPAASRRNGCARSLCPVRRDARSAGSGPGVARRRRRRRAAHPARLLGRRRPRRRPRPARPTRRPGDALPPGVTRTFPVPQVPTITRPPAPVAGSAAGSRPPRSRADPLRDDRPPPVVTVPAIPVTPVPTGAGIDSLRGTCPERRARRGVPVGRDAPAPRLPGPGGAARVRGARRPHGHEQRLLQPAGTHRRHRELGGGAR